MNKVIKIIFRKIKILPNFLKFHVLNEFLNSVKSIALTIFLVFFEKNSYIRYIQNVLYTKYQVPVNDFLKGKKIVSPITYYYKTDIILQKINLLFYYMFALFYLKMCFNTIWRSYYPTCIKSIYILKSILIKLQEAG